MGCNTSKESVQTGAEDAKEDIKNGDIPKSAASDGIKEEETKEEQVDTTFVTSDGENVGESNEPSDKEKEAAATRIQAVFRGHHARKSMRDTEQSSQEKNNTGGEEELTKEQLQEEFREDDVELCNAATKIQASFRGHMSRKEQATGSVVKAAGDLVESAVGAVEQKVDDAVNELEGIDLTDPDLHKAATKIQASFRGHKVRQEVPITAETPKK